MDSNPDREAQARALLGTRTRAQELAELMRQKPPPGREQLYPRVYDWYLDGDGSGCSLTNVDKLDTFDKKGNLHGRRMTAVFHEGSKEDILQTLYSKKPRKQRIQEQKKRVEEFRRWDEQERIRDAEIQRQEDLKFPSMLNNFYTNGYYYEFYTPVGISPEILPDYLEKEVAFRKKILAQRGKPNFTEKFKKHFWPPEKIHCAKKRCANFRTRGSYIDFRGVKPSTIPDTVDFEDPGVELISNQDGVFGADGLDGGFTIQLPPRGVDSLTSSQAADAYAQQWKPSGTHHRKCLIPGPSFDQSASKPRSKPSATPRPSSKKGRESSVERGRPLSGIPGSGPPATRARAPRPPLWEARHPAVVAATPPPPPPATAKDKLQKSASKTSRASSAGGHKSVSRKLSAKRAGTVGSTKSDSKLHRKSKSRPSSRAGSEVGSMKSKSDTRLHKKGKKSVLKGGKGKKGKGGKKIDLTRTTVVGYGHKDVRVSKASPSQRDKIGDELEYIRFPSIMGWYFDGHQFSMKPFELNAYYAKHFNNLQAELDTIAHYENEETFTEKARRNFWPPEWLVFMFRTRGVYLDFDEFRKDPPQSPPEYNFEHEHPLIGVYTKKGDSSDEEDAKGRRRSRKITLSPSKMLEEDGKKKKKKTKIPRRKKKKQPQCELIIPTGAANVGIPARPACWEEDNYQTAIPFSRPACQADSFNRFFNSGPSCDRSGGGGGGG